jgi:hypothetical protein
MRHASRMALVSAWCIAATLATAAPPVVTVPAEVTGEVAAFVVVKAEVKEARAVKFVPLDGGLSVFPSGLLADPTVTVVVAQKSGRYRILCYSGNADGPSEPVTVTVVISGAAEPDKPVKPDPVKPAVVYYFAVVGAEGPVSPAVAAVMKLPAWDELRKLGHVVNYIPANELSSGLTRPLSLPAVMILKKDGAAWVDTGANKPLPTNDESIRGLLK